MIYKKISTDKDTLKSYILLFKECFPSAAHFSIDYLNWLYLHNPDGKVVGFNAFSGEVLAGHYACIPVMLNIEGDKTKGLLSLNTAVHPSFQGQGLFTTLAEKTYEYAAKNGFSCVYGVANAQSTPGFLRKLGFQNVAKLSAKLGFLDMTLDRELCDKSVTFYREWSQQTLEWRKNNPSNPLSFCSDFKGFSCFTGPTNYKLVRAYAPIYGNASCGVNGARSGYGLKLYIGLLPNGTCNYKSYLDIPEKLKPSPLNFIYKNLGSSAKFLDPSSIMLGFHDFDVF
jgi:GNAT superfamily N-acetyltransferase